MAYLTIDEAGKLSIAEEGGASSQEADADGILQMLKIDLGIMTEAYDARLAQYIVTAQANMDLEGAALDASRLDDMQLIVTYAAWTWRRRDTMEGMPRMLRWQLNNRIFAGKMADG